MSDKGEGNLATDPNTLFGRAVVKAEVEKRFGQAEETELFYRDKEALKAMHRRNEVIDLLGNGEMSIPGIDVKKLIHFIDEGPIQGGSVEFNKVIKFVSEETGVSIDRMDQASKFWLENFLGGSSK